MFGAPFLRRHITIPLWVLKDRSQRLSSMRELEKSQYDSISQIRERQFQALKDMIRHAFKDTVYYRELFRQCDISPEDIKEPEDIKKIPILTKKHIQEHGGDLIAKQYKLEKLILFKTGGSTGKPLTVYCNHDALEQGVGSAYRAFKWTGWKIGEPWGRVWGNPPKDKTIKDKLRNAFIEPQIFLDTMNLNEDTICDFVKRWKRAKPTILHGHSHSLYIVAQFCKSMAIKDMRPKGIISTSMKLIPSEREVIENVFKCKVTDLYGCEEVGLIACECEEHNGMHLNMENLYVELINPSGHDALPDEEGAIVVTSLMNRAMPLIRYNIEDVGVPSGRSCNCGRTLPLMEKVTGRVADFLIRRDGSLVAGVSLVERTITAVAGIEQMQIIQEDLDTIILNIVKNEQYSEITEQHLRQEFLRVFGQSLVLRFNFVKSIPQESNGKYRFSITKVPGSYQQ